MPLYRLYAGSPEESYDTRLEHDETLEAHALQALWEDCLRRVARVHRQRELDLCRQCLAPYAQNPPERGTPAWRDRAFWRRMRRRPRIQYGDVWEAAVDLMVARHGFRRPEHAVTLTYGAWDTLYPRHREF